MFGVIVRVSVVSVLMLCIGSASLAQEPTVDDYYELQRTVVEQERRLKALESDRIFEVNPIKQASSMTESMAVNHRLSEIERFINGINTNKVQNNDVTQKWFGRVHYDHWAVPGASPLPNFLETGDPTIAPRDLSGFRRLRFGVQGDVSDTMVYKIAMDFASPQNLAFKDAFLGWKELPFFQKVLLGNQKRPYGLDHLNSSRYNVFMERPLTVEAYNADSRRFGIQSYGVSDDQFWNWRYGYFLMDDLSKVGNQRTDNYQSEFAGRLASTLWYDETCDGRHYAHVAVSGSLGFPGGGPDSKAATRPEARTVGRWYDDGGHCWRKSAPPVCPGRCA